MVKCKVKTEREFKSFICNQTSAWNLFDNFVFNLIIASKFEIVAYLYVYSHAAKHSRFRPYHFEAILALRAARQFAYLSSLKRSVGILNQSCVPVYFYLWYWCSSVTVFSFSYDRLTSYGSAIMSFSKMLSLVRFK